MKQAHNSTISNDVQSNTTFI